MEAHPHNHQVPARDAKGREIVNVHDAKTNLSKFLARVEAGEEFVVARGGNPVATLQAYRKPSRRDFLGCMKGQIEGADDLLLPDPEIEEMFGMR